MQSTRWLRAGAVAVFLLLTGVGAAALVLMRLARAPLWPDFIVNILFYTSRPSDC